MAATYLGAFTVGGCVVGLSGAFSTVGSALSDLAVVVTAQTALLDAKVTELVDASASIAIAFDQLAALGVTLSAIADAVLAAKAAIRIPAIADFQIQLNAAIQIQAQLGLDVSDPSAYVAALLSGIAQVELAIEAFVPSVALNAQIAAAASAQISAEAKIAAVDLALDVLVSINVQLAAQVALVAQLQASVAVQVAALASISAALTAIKIALNVALAAAAAPLAAYASMTAALGATGGQAFVYSGPLNGLGAALDAVTPSSGVAGTTPVLCPVMFVQQSDTPAVTSTNAVYRTS